MSVLAARLLQAGSNAGKSICKYDWIGNTKKISYKWVNVWLFKVMKPLRNNANVNSIRMSSHDSSSKFTQEAIQYSCIGAGMVGLLVGLLVAGR